MALGTATVDTRAVTHNAGVLAAHGGGQLMAVVKADGFGHGAVPVARAALAGGAGWLGVATCAEALALRAAGIAAPTLAWLVRPGEDCRAAVAAGVDLAAGTPDQLVAAAAAGRAVGREAAVHLKVDTGLARNGAAPQDWPELVRWAGKLAAEGGLRVRAVWSHLACADEPGHPSVPAQLTVFDEAVAHARAAGLDPVRHLANSAAALAVPAARYDLVRAGIGLYGVEPVRGRRFGLRPALTLTAPVVSVRRVPAGTPVSYGHQYVTRRATTLALVGLGYADGVPRAAGPCARVWLAGARHPVAGAVTMDSLVLDVGDAPVAVGDEAVLWGAGRWGEPTAADWAGWAGTNPHEILTGLGARTARRYLPTGFGDHLPAGGGHHLTAGGGGD
ncbi:MAG TPA: alanine racemase [Pilimelia sp.]|nr:alanine racemase [Pilimelia sp.]